MEECYTSGLGIAVPDQPTIIDIGANAGFFSVFAASRFPDAKIFSYEPIPNNFRQLQRNKRLNRDAQIFCFPKAVHSNSGEISLSFDPSDIFTTSASIFETPGFQSETIRVPCVTLSEIFDEHHIERCDLLKMDCEGAEYDILYSCPQNDLLRVSQMAIEVHKGTAPNQDMEFLIDYLTSNGFKTRRYSKHMLSAWR
ncbi:FkbM family methyltransferase [Thermodesulfobacteriota bacterium]